MEGVKVWIIGIKQFEQHNVQLGQSGILDVDVVINVVVLLVVVVVWHDKHGQGNGKSVVVVIVDRIDTVLEPELNVCWIKVELVVELVKFGIKLLKLADKLVESVWKEVLVIYDVVSVILLIFEHVLQQKILNGIPLIDNNELQISIETKFVKYDWHKLSL